MAWWVIIPQWSSVAVEMETSGVICPFLPFSLFPSLSDSVYPTHQTASVFSFLTPGGSCQGCEGCRLLRDPPPPPAVPLPLPPLQPPALARALCHLHILAFFLITRPCWSVAWTQTPGAEIHPILFPSGAPADGACRFMTHRLASSSKNPSPPRLHSLSHTKAALHSWCGSTHVAVFFLLISLRTNTNHECECECCSSKPNTFCCQLTGRHLDQRKG